MPTATPAPALATAAGANVTLMSIIARLCALNSTDPQIIALLATWQSQTGAPLQ
jgi:hypothetical protein